MTSIVQPENVTSPRERLTLVKILVKNLPNAGGHGGTCSIALVLWDGQPRLAIRYDGRTQTPLGHPVSNSHAVWFQIPVCLQQLFMPAIPVEHWGLVTAAFENAQRQAEVA